MEVMHELGLLSEFRKLPHQHVPQPFAQIGADSVQIADLSRRSVRAPFVAMMPQWDFLSFLTEKAKAYHFFRLIMSAEGSILLTEDGRITGVYAETGGRDDRDPSAAVYRGRRTFVTAQD